jgi:hypothetical protein
MSLLRSHMKTVESWLVLVQEVVILERESADGKVDYLKRALRGNNVRFFHHPRGLYPTWNFGIFQTGSKFTYRSTVVLARQARAFEKRPRGVMAKLRRLAKRLEHKLMGKPV